jgi:hypothetical protein
MAIPVKGGRGTQQAIIVQRLDYRNAFGSGGVIGGGRDEREGIVKVENVWPFSPEQFLELLVWRPIPNGFEGNWNRKAPGDEIIMGCVDNDLVSVAYQQLGFGGEDAILAAGLLVVVVRH